VSKPAAAAPMPRPITFCQRRTVRPGETDPGLRHPYRPLRQEVHQDHPVNAEQSEEAHRRPRNPSSRNIRWKARCARLRLVEPDRVAPVASTVSPGVPSRPVASTHTRRPIRSAPTRRHPRLRHDVVREADMGHEPSGRSCWRARRSTVGSSSAPNSVRGGGAELREKPHHGLSRRDRRA